MLFWYINSYMTLNNYLLTKIYVLEEKTYINLNLILEYKFYKLLYNVINNILFSTS